MNSSRCQHLPLESPKQSKWFSLGVVAAIACGALFGLALGSVTGEQSLYAPAAVRTVSSVQVQPLAMPRTNAVTSLEANDVMVAQAEESSFPQGTYVQQPATSWASLAIIPVAAAVGFMLGSRGAKRDPQPLNDTFEVVIDGEPEIAMAATTGAKTSLYAVVAIGGHQYIVQPGQILSVDKLPLQIGDEFSFEKVLLLKDGDKVEWGHPYLDNVKITAEVLRNSKGKKIRIFKYRAKKHYRLSKGHRQKYTDIHITEIAGHKVPSKVDFEALQIA